MSSNIGKLMVDMLMDSAHNIEVSYRHGTLYTWSKFCEFLTLVA